MKKLKKVLLITEYINPPYDEGIKKTVYNLYVNLRKRYEVMVICRHGFENDHVFIVDTNPLYYSKKIKSLIRGFNPDVLIYFPFQSSTFASYLRLKVISILADKSDVLLIALQPKPVKKWQIQIIKKIKPKYALTPSPTLKAFWDELEIYNEQVPLLTDLTVFKPISKDTTKENLRNKYNLPQNAYIITHMGHLNEGRNLETLIPLQKSGFQIVIIASSSTPTDAIGQKELKNNLLSTGIIIFDKYLENIEEIYQLSDIYIFPVVLENSSIGMPLSILEARACSIPVITTNYGSIKSYIGDDFGGIWYSEPKKFLNSVFEIKNRKDNNFNRTKVADLNNLFYEKLYNLIDQKWISQ